MTTPSSLEQRRAFDLELERVRLRAMRAAVQLGGGDGAQLDRAVLDLEQRRSAHRGARDRGLSARLGLTPDETALMWSAVAAMVDPLLTPHLDALGHRSGRAGCSVAQLALIDELDAARARGLVLRLEQGSPLAHCQLVRVTEAGWATPLSGFVAAPRLVTYLAGDDAIDAELGAAGMRVPEPAAVITDDRLARVVERIRAIAASPSPIAIAIEGPRGVGRRTAARLGAARPVVSLELSRVAGGSIGAAFAGLIRECTLTEALPAVVGTELLDGTEAEAATRRAEVARLIALARGPVFLIGTRRSALELAVETIHLELPVPPVATRRGLWQAAFGDAGATPAATAAIERAAMRYAIGPAQIRAAATSAAAAARGSTTALDDALLADGVRTTMHEQLGRLATRGSTRHTWDDLVLPDDTREQIELLMTRGRHAYQVLERWGFGRHVAGNGLAALFSGPPGTGKTMVAGLIARELDLTLYRVDMAQVVSKWVGETEKQLDQVFAAADGGHVLLLFDEADSLFAKRTEVKGANERFANMEVNYLLQRLESFTGIALLTTNMDTSLDPALRRRLAAHIVFPQPDQDERAELWRRMLPADAPRTGDLDFEELAEKFSAFSGANIRNAAVLSGFLAAEGGHPISQDVLQRAAREESRSMGRIVNTGGMR